MPKDQGGKTLAPPHTVLIFVVTMRFTKLAYLLLSILSANLSHAESFSL
jgi:hypothetical protein